MAVPFVMIECPVPEQLPEDLSGCERNNVEVWALVHSAPKRAPCQKASHDLIGELSLDEVNLSHHAWLLHGLDAALTADPNLSIVTCVRTGVFGAKGVSPTHQELACVESRGLPFGCVEAREVTVHGGGCFSPCNNMLRLNASHIFHHFTSISVGRRPSSTGEGEGTLQGALVLHIVPAHEAAELRLRTLVDTARGLSDICAAIAAVDAEAGEAFSSLLLQSAPDTIARIEVAVQQQRERVAETLRGLPMLEPWQPPSVASGGGHGELEVALDRGGDVVALATMMLELGCPDFDLNMEVLASTGGDLEAALQVLHAV